MKKGIPKVLSVMCVIASLSGMFGMNRAGAIKVTAAEISTIFRCCYEQIDMSILKIKNNEIDNEKFINVVIYKLINFIRRHLGERSEDFIEQLISRMDGRELYERVTDQKLRFICTLAESLKEIVDERSFVFSEAVYKQFIFFYDNILSMSIIINQLSERTDISEYTKKACVIEIIDTIKEMGGSLNAINHKYMRLLRFIVMFCEPDEFAELDKLGWVIREIKNDWKRDLSQQCTQLA